MATTKLELVKNSLIVLVRQVLGTKLYVVDKNKDEYLVKYVSKGEYNISFFPKGKTSRKKLKTKDPLAFLTTLTIRKMLLINDKLNPKEANLTLCVYGK